MVRGGYWSLKSLSFIQFDLWNLNLKISLLAWDWCAISSEMRNRKKTNSNIVTRCQKYLSRKVSVWHFWKKIGRLVSCQKKVTLLPLNYLGLLSQSWLTLPWQHLVFGMEIFCDDCHCKIIFFISAHKEYLAWRFFSSHECKAIIDI